MRLDKVLKGFLISLLVMVIAACSSNKNFSKNRSNKGIVSTKAGVSGNSTIDALSSSDKAASSQLQQLQHDNIVYFDLDKYNIRSEFITTLDANANFLCSNPSYKVIIEGHADERGTPEYNISLGERRANAVQMYLQGKGVSANQISIISYGKEKPAVLGHDEDVYAKNRRAILIYSE